MNSLDIMTNAHSEWTKLLLSLYITNINVDINVNHNHY